MNSADLIILIATMVVLLLGYFFGFGKTLKLATSGIVGKIISIFVCYFLFGIVLDWGFVQRLLISFTQALLENGSWLCKALLFIRIDLIVFAISLFVIVQLIRVIVVNLIDKFFEIDNTVMKVINKTLGVVFAFLIMVMLLLFVFQILAWITGVNGSIYQGLKGSFFGLDKIFVNNPLNSIMDSINIV